MKIEIRVLALLLLITQLANAQEDNQLTDYCYHGNEKKEVNSEIAFQELALGLFIRLTPDKNGVMPPEVVKSAKELGDEFRRRFGQKIKGISVEETIFLDLGKKTNIKNIVLMEDVTVGQKVAAFEIDIKKAEGWETIYKSRNAGHKHIIPMVEETDKLRFI